MKNDNFKLVSLKDNITNGCHILQFADEFVLFSKHEDLSVAVMGARTLNLALIKFSNWCDDHNLEVRPLSWSDF
ncbi:hypothetical protein QE152_g1207 [Popillia japonica]|uniref:Reverse transcriptase domain-containing protein n=1 Tax=Popillia japonica TaxID=7064 RepID=A0AAW1N857_POPJA